MAEQIKNIDKYYTDLQYDIDKTTAKEIIKACVIMLQLKNIENLSERFFETASLIKKHFKAFVAFCEHVDVVTALIEYLNYYGAKILFELNELSTGYKSKFIHMTLTSTFFTMCKGEKDIISFLDYAVFEPTLSSLIEGCTKFITFYENSNGYCTQNLELINSSKAIGIIILREKNETILLLRLTQCLLAGNSVIVICNEKFSNIKSYLNIFSMCDIPPGVLNMLSSECIENLESRLCGIEYSDYAKQYFSEEPIFEKYKNYTNLYLEKQIAHVLK
ncbi:uncharacterized protein LOC114928495 isoform X3 [Nylanderia fulva]|uniref:uncharacterized protein LOC114928495 isoform X3 n=1 Tax=Nylanderia fulva TaxID=613905 RepID=UPI0010FB1D38|nr:uncharacterized protein LOC114928495 isoform X3 [Nylanderia fulva]